MSAPYLLGLVLLGSDLPLSPDLESAAAAAVAEIRALLFSVPEPAGDSWVLRRERGSPEEILPPVLAALAREGVAAEVGKGGGGVVLEVGHLRTKGGEALVLKVLSPPGGVVLAPFVRKEWVRGPPPAPGKGGIACRGESEVEIGEARATDRAIAAGAAQLRQDLARCGIDRRSLDRLLPDGEAARRFLKDLFVRREGSGETWRAQSFFQATGEEIRGLAREAARIDSQIRGSRLRRALGLLGIAGASFLLYLWLDFATSGRWTNQVRLLALGLAAGGAVALL
ncbi:MAG: hypothetical protein L0323_16825 [Planctomycetes bacterium]|nr:hypothetical protein [Planctomycetota bacterium]